jgi:hypothetical protein
MISMTPEAKSKLSATIEKLREKLLHDFQNAANSCYRLTIPIEKAGLTEENNVKRRRLENWLDEQARSESKAKKETYAQARERHYQSAIKLSAATFLNRIVVIRHMEAVGLIKPSVVTGGWHSSGYREFREFAPSLLKNDTEGFETLLNLLYDELSLDLPGLFGEVGVCNLFPVPAMTLRSVIEAFDHKDLDSVWTDDTALGWVYQFWNDKERKALDDKIRNRGKIEKHEIAAKTQLFTERYMVEWLLQNSLNNQWLAICEKNGWTCHPKSNGTFDALEKRRKTWRAKRNSGEVSPEALMPIETEEEQRWKYWTKHPLSKELIVAAPESIRDIKILDPAVGSGHFLIIAFDLLAAFYREEAQHRCEKWTSREIADSIIENNLHGVDIDPRAVQIAAAALLLKARSFCRDASPRKLNLVASNLGLAFLPNDDPAVHELQREVELATGIPKKLTEKIIHAFRGADYLGSLLKVDECVDEAIREHERTGGLKRSDPKSPHVQKKFWGPLPPDQSLLTFDEAKVSVLEELDKFLDKCTSGDDLGLRLRGEQLATGVRFIRLIKQGEYDLVVANPPYLGGAKIEEKSYIDNNYPEGKADLYAVFLKRGLEFTKPIGFSAMITMRGWMFINDYKKLRGFLKEEKSIFSIADLHFGAFPEMKDVSTTMSILTNTQKNANLTKFIKPVKNELVVRDLTQINRNISGLMAPYETWFRPIDDFSVIEGQPFVYWWDDDFLRRYNQASKIGNVSPAKKGACTSNNSRFIRYPWEVKYSIQNLVEPIQIIKIIWAPYVMGAKGREWFEGLYNVVNWKCHGLEVKVFNEYLYRSYTRSIQNQDVYFKLGVAFSTIGSNFSARKHRYPSIIDTSGSSVFCEDRDSICALMNSSIGKSILNALNPTINFKNADVNRLPLFHMNSGKNIFEILDQAFTEHESARETSVEFKNPGPSAWKYSQEWAQEAVDRPEDTPLPKYKPIYDDLNQLNYISYSIGVAIGRFGAKGEGILNIASESALPAGILYLSAHSDNDTIKHHAFRPIHETWAKYGRLISKGASLKKWLMHSFFKDVHLDMYEKRPIYFPLSSKKRNYVAFISIHRWADDSLQTLLADYLIPELNQIDGELQDLMETRKRGDKKNQAEAEDRYTLAKTFYDELKEFVDLVRQCAEKGPPPANPKDISREANARYKMDLGDGVMINSAALWPLLEPQWKQPKIWWSELCNAEGKKDYDWAHLAAIYFPKRVDAKGKKDPSLAVAHGCFWKYHPEIAYKWELRLKDEIGPDFTINEKDSDDLRAVFENEHPDKVKELVKAEEKRRKKKQKNEYYPLFSAGGRS